MSKIIIKTPQEIEGIRAACKVTAQILDAVGEIIKPGISTEDINTFVEKMMHDFGVLAATLNYKGYPKSVCTSVNDVICHGIPNPYEILKAGDIINVDVTSIKDGFFGDSSRMYFVGGIESCAPDLVELVDITKKSLFAGINEVAPNKNFGDIGAAIQEFIAETKKNYGIVVEYTGHGVGKAFHEDPQVVHVGRRGSGPKMKPGMTFTIEPMINLGTAKTKLSKIDGWTVRTVDGKHSAQWEHTLLVTDSGYEILT